MFRVVVVLAMVVLGRVAAAAPASAGGAGERPADLPKPAPRGDDGSDAVRVAQLPPFLGFFGPVSLLRKTGFRGKPGSWMELRAGGSAAGAGTMRIQWVGPEVRGGRWLEIVMEHGAPGGLVVRMLTRGEGNGNVERMVLQGPGLAPLEVPLGSAEIGLDKALGGPAGPFGGDVRHAGRESVTVPLGKFQADKWVVKTPEGDAEIWTTSDPKVPFAGILRMKTKEGTAETTAVGTDAVSRMPGY